MEKAIPKVSKENTAKKRYVKPELTKHKALREITMASLAQGACGTCAFAAGICV